MKQHLVICGALLALFVTDAYGDGRYHRTKDGKTLVWNNNPRPGDAATWSGGRDSDGYATGQGTVTWFTKTPKFTTGSNIPKTRYVELTRYTGKMLRGKLEGLAVRVDADGKTSPGKLVDERRGKNGVPSLPSAQTPAPVAADEQRRNEPAQQQASVVEKQPPAEGPPPAVVNQPGYHLTKDGKTLVWNNNPRPGDAATWSGGRDSDGYATGQGTVTWFTKTPKFTTGSNIPKTRYVELTRYTGKMLRGKLEGLAVRVDADGKTSPGKLVDERRGKNGVPSLPSAQTPAPVAADEQRRNEPAQQQASVVEKQPPAEGPPPAVVNQPGYHLTKDGKTLVWNNNPRPGDAATWSGGRDSDGYATGQGTVTWFTKTPKFTTGSNIPKARYVELTRYTGKMLRGKLEGLAVRVDADGKTSPGKLVDERRGKNGVPSLPSAQTPAPVAADEQRRNEPAQQQASVVEKQPPAEGPPPAVVNQPPLEPVPEPTVTETPGQDMDDSLRALIGPPSALRTEAPSPKSSIPPTASSSASGPRLTSAEVTELAEAEARGNGYHPSDYQRSPVSYSAADETWSISYAQRSADGHAKLLRVSVEDKTKKASIATAR